MKPLALWLALMASALVIAFLYRHDSQNSISKGKYENFQVALSLLAVVSGEAGRVLTDVHEGSRRC